MSLLTWIYSKKDELEVEFSTESWPMNSGLKLYDYETSVKHNGAKLIGRGVDSSEPLAIIKSVSEAIERLICNEFDISSVGLAIQSLEDQNFDADLHAKCEVLERYYLKQHIDFGRPFEMVHFKFDLLNIFTKNNYSCKVTFLKMNTPEGYYGIGCILEKNKHISIGFSFANNEMEAVEKSFAEALPNYFWLQDNKISEEEKPWHISSRFISKIKELCVKADHGNDNDGIKIELPEIEVINIDLLKHQLLSTAPIKVKSFRIKNGI